VEERKEGRKEGREGREAPSEMEVVMVVGSSGESCGWCMYQVFIFHKRQFGHTGSPIVMTNHSLSLPT